MVEGKEPENTPSFSSVAAHIWSGSEVYVCPCSWVGGVDCFSCCGILTLASVLSFLCVAGVRCSALTVPFGSCQPASQAWKLILLPHKYFPFLGFQCFCERFALLLMQAGRILSHLPTSLAGVCYWLGSWGTPAEGAQPFLLVKSVVGVWVGAQAPEVLAQVYDNSIFPAREPAVTL